MTLEQQVTQRLEHAGDTSPGAFNLAADILELASIEAWQWTNCPEDAGRIPHMIDDAVRQLRQIAKGIK